MRPSIRRRLLLLTVLLTVAVVGCSAAFIWWRMDRYLRRELDQSLQTAAIALAGRLEEENGRLEFELETGNLAQANIHGEVLIQVLSDDGRVVFSSPSLQGTSISAGRADRSKPERDVYWFDASLAPESRACRVVALHATAAAEEESRRAGRAGDPLRAWVFVARPLASIEKTMRRLGLTLAAAVLLATAIALAGGYAVAIGGTRPIKEMADRIAGVEPGRPRLQVDAARVPMELDPIVSKTEDLLQRIDEELSRQRQLTANVAHDLRTPVAGVRTLLDVCIQRERTPEEYLATIGQAQAALRQLSLLLDNVLTLARLDADGPRPPASTVTFSIALADAVATIKPMASARGVAIETVGKVDYPVACDRAMLAKILTNLLANAVEYGPPHARVTVSAERTGNHVAMLVRDSGTGIPVDRRERIFDRFYRGDQARTGSAGHSGLGLPIARGIARRFGGDVYLAAKSSDGNDFVIELPTTGDGAGPEPNQRVGLGGPA